MSKKPVNIESVLSSLNDSDSDESVATKSLSSGKARATNTKSVSCDVNSKPKSKVNTGVNEKSKVNHSKLSHVSRRQHHSGKSVEICSESKSNIDKRSTSTRRRTFIRPDRFDGATPWFATFKAHFENAVQFNRWCERKQLAHLKASLVEAASQCLWDQSPNCVNTLNKLWKLLSDRFGVQKLMRNIELNSAISGANMASHLIHCVLMSGVYLS